MIKLNLKGLMKKYILGADAMNGSELEKVFSYPIYPNTYSNEGFTTIDNGLLGGNKLDFFLYKR